jgi:energy-coupling factor transporter transmembrane protein EcfT
MALENSKLMKWVGTVVFLTFAIFNVLMLVSNVKGHYQFGPEVAGPYSIFSSEKFFLAYHIWGIILPIVCTYGMWKETRMLFFISLLLLMLLMFYPFFTSSPLDKAEGQAMVDREKAIQDSINSLNAPAQLDSVPADSAVGE